MPLISRVGRRRPKARLALGIIYVLLSLGALTTVYPFAVMAGLGLKGAIDQNDGRLIPGYLVDDEAYFARWQDERHAGNKDEIAAVSMRREPVDPSELDRYEAWVRRLPPDGWTAGFRTAPGQATSRLSQKWQEWLRSRYGTIDRVNQAFTEVVQTIGQVSPPPELLERPGWRPRLGRKWSDWLEFKKTLPLEFRIPLSEQKLWTDYLRTTGRGRLDSIPAPLRGGAALIEEIPASAARSGLPWVAEFDRQWQKERNEGLIWSERARPAPVLALERRLAFHNPREARWEMATRSYRYVAGFLFRDGRVLWNTFLFCLLAVAVQLVVNPACAYALSRFPHRSTGAVLAFLLATMAFPAEVAMIPSFLLLKDLGLLNTLAALVLPAAASGFMIFLLKGFFDSLPREIFESGQIDGAPEWLMMVRLALPLSRPVLGYLALLAFMGAYGSFMFAFLVVQKREMWTLMVMIYQMQGYAPKSVMMAALTLAALPTVAVFLAAQRAIMKGIILPGEK